MAKSSSTYIRELNVLTNTKTKKSVRDKLIKNLTKEYGCSKNDLERILDKRIKIAKKYDAINNGLAEIEGRTKTITDIYAKQAQNFVDKELEPILKKIRKEFPDVFKSGKKLSESEIEEKVTKALKNKKVNTDLQEAIKKYEEALGKSGVSNEAKTKAKEALETAEKALKEKANELGKQVAKGGMNPWIAGTIGAVALGLAGFLAGRSNET